MLNAVLSKWCVYRVHFQYICARREMLVPVYIPKPLAPLLCQCLRVLGGRAAVHVLTH